jgi:adenylate cyclase
MNLLVELKRRNVFRMAGLYLVVAWLIVQVAATLLPVFDAPAWVMKTLVALLVICFIPALIISWVFELTPDGLQREDESAPADSIYSTEPSTAQRMNRMIMVVMALALGYFAFDKFVLAPNRDPLVVAANTVAPINSIAVLPFQNNNSDADTEYLSDGLAESLIYRLAQLPDLKVSPSSSTQDCLI